jgi:hypothetical protein
MVLSVTFNNISIISWWSRKSECTEKTTDLPRVTNELYHKMLYRVHLAWVGFEHTTLVVIATDYIGNCKSNYHTNTTAPTLFDNLIKISIWSDYRIIFYNLLPSMDTPVDSIARINVSYRMMYHYWCMIILGADVRKSDWNSWKWTKTDVI